MQHDIYVLSKQARKKKRFIIASIYRSFIQWDLEIEVKKKWVEMYIFVSIKSKITQKTKSMKTNTFFIYRKKVQNLYT